MEWEVIEGWLLGSIPGVIAVGIFGSVLGSILLSCVKAWWKAGIDRRLEFAQKALFPLRVMIHNSWRLRDEAGPRTPDGKYVVYVMVQCVFAMAGVMALFMSLGFCIYIYLEYGLERPQVLSSFVGSTLFFFYLVVKDFMLLWLFVSDDISELDDRIEEEAPKSLQAWREMKEQQQAIEASKKGE